MPENEYITAWSDATFEAQLLLSLNELEQAQDLYIEALNAAYQIYSDEPIYYAQTTVALSSLALQQGDPEAAITLLHDVLTIYSSSYPPCHPKMIELYHLTANIFHAAAYYDDADYWYQMTLANMEHLPWNHVDKQAVAANYLQLLEETNDNMREQCAS